jgi:hypothetical protein
MVHLTDGFLIAEAVPTLCSTITGSALKRAVDNLVSVGSWEPVDGGYRVHDYLRHNASKQQVEEDLEQGRKRYQRWMDKRRSNAVTNALDEYNPNAVATPLLTQPTVCLSDIKPTTSKGDSRHTKPTKLENQLQASLEAIKAKHPELGNQEPAG